MKRKHVWELDKECSGETCILDTQYESYDNLLVRDCLKKGEKTGDVRIDLTITRIKSEMFADDRTELCLRLFARSRRRTVYDLNYCWASREISEAMVKEFMH